MPHDMRSRDYVARRQWQWGCLWVFACVGWIVAIVYLVADLVGQGLDLF